MTYKIDPARIRHTLLEYESHRHDGSVRDTVQQYLHDYTSLKRQMTMLSAHATELIEAYDKARISAEYRGRKHAPELEKQHNRLLWHCSRLFFVLSDIARHCDTVVDMLMLVDCPEAREVLVCHYLDGLSLKEVGCKVNHCRTDTIRLHREGLDAIRSKLEFPIPPKKCT